MRLSRGYSFILGATVATVATLTISALPPLTFPPDPLPDLVERIGPGVVNISSVQVISENVMGMEQFLQMWGLPQERKTTARGSGFLIDKDGFVLTNNHVVAEADEVIVTLADKHDYRARIVGKDPKMDIALLQIRDKDRHVPAKIQPLELGDSDKVRIAQTVIAIGNPFGLQNTVTRGIISAQHRTIGIGPFDNFLQTDASINPGNSGGPLFNLAGEVIGINSAIFSRTGQSSGLGFAIPINEAKKILPDLKKYGRVPRPWLGIVGERITPALADYYGLGRKDGILIYNLVENGPADEAGIHRGDIIVKIASSSTPEPLDLERELAKLKPGDKTNLTLQRGKKTLELSIQLKDLPPRLDQLPQGII